MNLADRMKKTVKINKNLKKHWVIYRDYYKEFLGSQELTPLFEFAQNTKGKLVFQFFCIFWQYFSSPRVFDSGDQLV